MTAPDEWGQRARGDRAGDETADSPFLAATERLENDDRLDAVAEALRQPGALVSSGRARQVLSGEWLGHALHPLLTDFPLGCWIGAGLLDLAGGRASRRAAQRLVGLGVVFVAPTALSGLSDWTAAADDERVRRVGAAHASLNTIVGTLYAASWMLRRRQRHGAGVALGMLGASAAWVSGYLGGHLTLRRGVGVAG